MQIYTVYTYPCPKPLLLFPALESLLSLWKTQELVKRKFKLRKILKDKSCVKQELSGLSLRTADALLQMTTLYTS